MIVPAKAYLKRIVFHLLWNNYVAFCPLESIFFLWKNMNRKSGTIENSLRIHERRVKDWHVNSLMRSEDVRVMISRTPFRRNRINLQGAQKNISWQHNQGFFSFIKDCQNAPWHGHIFFQGGICLIALDYLFHVEFVWLWITLKYLPTIYLIEINPSRGKKFFAKAAGCNLRLQKMSSTQFCKTTCFFRRGIWGKQMHIWRAKTAPLTDQRGWLVLPFVRRNKNSNRHRFLSRKCWVPGWDKVSNCPSVRMMKLESLQTTRSSHSFKQMLREVLNNNVDWNEG